MPIFAPVSLGRRWGYNITTTGVQPLQVINGYSTYAIQVYGVGAVATAWDVRLQGGLSGSFVDVLTHVTATGNAVIVYSGANKYSLYAIRVYVPSLTLGPATALTVMVMGTP
jgi:hypothetical protein